MDATIEQLFAELEAELKAANFSGTIAVIERIFPKSNRHHFVMSKGDDGRFRFTTKIGGLVLTLELEDAPEVPLQEPEVAPAAPCQESEVAPVVPHQEPVMPRQEPEVAPVVPLPEVSRPAVPRQKPKVASAVPLQGSKHNELTNKHRKVISDYILLKTFGFEASDKPAFNEYIKSLRRFDQLNPVEKSLILNHENARGAKQRHYPSLTPEEEDIVRKAEK